MLYQLLQHADAENIGYVIPTPVMEHFINDYERNGQYTAFPALGIEWQKMESPFMRKALGMQVRICQHGCLRWCICSSCTVSSVVVTALKSHWTVSLGASDYCDPETRVQ